MCIQRDLTQAIHDAAADFESGELAFLALTSKIEMPFIDRLAFRLHQRFHSQNLMVAREWPIPTPSGRPPRADLAILKPSGATVVVEGKAMYSFDPTRNSATNTRFVERMQSDLDRLTEAALAAVPIYCLLLATHPLTPVPERLHHGIKYPRKINSAFDRIGSESQIRELADRKVREAAVPGSICAAGTEQAGTSFGIPVELLWWLFGPFHSPDNLTVSAT
jgi:hypothetical protein